MNGDLSMTAAYTRRYWEVLSPIASALESLLRDQFQDIPRLDRITARAKSPARFLAKAHKRDSSGTPKYSDPLSEIQDQIGARIIVFYRRDVSSVAEAVTRYFRAIENKRLIPDETSRFGYSGQHLILSLPTEAIPSSVTISDAPEFFELQIKTLWQHAWSEANHDLGYKPTAPLDEDQQRMLAFTAAQAWGADKIFDELTADMNSKKAE